MIIYGLALLSACMFLGSLIGNLLGGLIGINSDVGGVGFAMILFMLLTEFLDKKKLMTKTVSSGIGFWSAMYIPVVVAMASRQNVYAAISGGAVAVLSGIAGCVIMFPLVKFITKFANVNKNWEKELNQQQNNSK